MREYIIDLPQEYGYLIERYLFEYNRTIQNLIFLSNKHSEDSDYLNNETHKNVFEKAVQSKATLWSYINAVIDMMLENNKSDKNYKKYYIITENNRISKIKILY